MTCKYRLGISDPRLTTHVPQPSTHPPTPIRQSRANTASQDNHEKRYAWVSYICAWSYLVCPISLGMGVCSSGPLGRRSSAINPYNKSIPDLVKLTMPFTFPCYRINVIKNFSWLCCMRYPFCSIHVIQMLMLLNLQNKQHYSSRFHTLD